MSNLNLSLTLVNVKLVSFKELYFHKNITFTISTRKLSAIAERVIEEGAPGPPGDGSQQEAVGVAAEDPVVGPGAAPRARVEDLVGDVRGGETRGQPRRPRVHSPVAREEPDEAN